MVIMIVDQSAEPSDDKRADAAWGLRQIIAEAEKHAVGASDQEIDAAIVEAMAGVRRRGS